MLKLLGGGMMYQALYRKWRPKTFDDLVGQDAVSATLKHQVAKGKLSHAYLFCGTRGTGKTSSAKILAKAVNCLSPQDGNPCCQCDICRGIEEESLLDVTEIDAASNSGVDNIRDLREEAHFTPVAGKYRVYIIDETHMLSVGAFNALLKILEEPPQHVIFILATTELHKVPATILSRCQRFDFSRIDSATIAARLSYIAGEENIHLTQDAALLVAKLADGSMRDALSLLDLVIAQGGEITKEVVFQRIGLVGRDHLFALAEAVASGDGGEVLKVAQSLWERSVDYLRLCEQLIGFYRDVMVAGAVEEPGELISCLPDELERFRSLARQMGMEGIMGCLAALQDTLARMGRGAQRRTELEATLVRMADPRLRTGTHGLLARIEKLERQVGANQPSQTATPVIPAELLQRLNALEQRLAQPFSAAQIDSGVKKEQSAPKDPPPEKIEKIPTEPFAEWSKVLDILQQKNRALFGTLVDSSAYVGGDLLLVDAGVDSMFAKMMRGNSYAKESLRAAVEQVTGKKYRLGPYNPERYEVKPKIPDKLDELLKKASELGVDVQVKE
ncbi:MAG: DNA polymerase III subunit gamma/tau [Oscillospiraceae bacterium]